MNGYKFVKISQTWPRPPSIHFTLRKKLQQYPGLWIFPWTFLWHQLLDIYNQHSSHKQLFRKFYQHFCYEMHMRCICKSLLWQHARSQDITASTWTRESSFSFSCPVFARSARHFFIMPSNSPILIDSFSPSVTYCKTNSQIRSHEQRLKWKI